MEEVFRDSGEIHTLVKVTNTILCVSTYWTLEKFDSRLKEMREMYQVLYMLCTYIYT